MARVMIIDDDPLVRYSLARVLEEEGHEVLEEADGQVALRHFAGDPVDVVVGDVYMPLMDGIQFLMRVRETFAETKIIMISGGGSLEADTVLVASSALGADAVLSKPISPADIRRAVRTALDTKDD